LQNPPLFSHGQIRTASSAQHFRNGRNVAMFSADTLQMYSFCTVGKQATLAWKKGGIPGAVKHEFLSESISCHFMQPSESLKFFSV
jgi:hypothetical protein